MGCIAIYGYVDCDVPGRLGQIRVVAASQVRSGGNATEDPPFGGLWCDQPALFLPATFLQAVPGGRQACTATP